VSLDTPPPLERELVSDKIKFLPEERVRFAETHYTVVLARTRPGTVSELFAAPKVR